MKKSMLYIIIIFICVLAMTVGYAAISDEYLYITGTVTASRMNGLFISGASVSSGSGTITAYEQSVLNSRVVLDANSSSSTVTMSVTIQNNSGEPKKFDKIIYDSSFYDNTNIVVETDSNLIHNQVVNDNSSVTFNITFKYDPTYIANNTAPYANVLNSVINFKFNSVSAISMDDIQLYAVANYTPQASTSSSTWSNDVTVNGYNASTQQYNLAKTTYTGNNSSGATFTKENLSWIVWSKDVTNSTVTLISTTPTSGRLALKGHTGYINGVFLMNEICSKLYGGGGDGISARALNLKDVEKKMIMKHGGSGYVDANGNPIWSEANVSNIISANNVLTVPYGTVSTITLVNNSQPYIPDMLGTDISNMDMESDLVTSPYASNSVTVSQQPAITVKQNIYQLTLANMSSLVDTEISSMLFGSNSYWMASRTNNILTAVGVNYGFAQSYFTTSGVNYFGQTKTSDARQNNSTNGTGNRYKLFPLITLDLTKINFTVEQNGSVTFTTT